MEESNTQETDEFEVSGAIQEILATRERVKKELSKVLIGQDEMVDLILISLLVKGHVLIEGVPGIAKTLTAKLFANAIDAKFSRIQFTPDLMPSDVLGTNIFNVKTQSFDFKSGPIFADIVVVDEINRAPAKTQSAMFEVMQEHQVSIDGVTRQMGNSFMVIATQNPIDNEGTYALPEAQLDRFLFKIDLGYPSDDEEFEILNRFKNEFGKMNTELIQKVISTAEIENHRQTIANVHVSDEMLRYIAKLIRETRQNGDLHLGASPRAGIWLMKASKAMAAFNGRAFVTPDDIKKVIYPALNHRVLLSPQREMEGANSRDIVQQIVEQVEVPR
jgi:MoxR-like ATPase